MQRLNYTQWIQFLALIGAGIFVSPVIAMPTKEATPTAPTPITQTTPTPATPAPGSTEAPTPQAAAPTIVDVASSNPSFKTLTAALKAADLTEALAAQGPFTVFAPTEEAFAALPKEVVEYLLKPENKAQLVKLLTYHVVAGAVTSDSLKSGSVKSLEGSPIAVQVSQQGVRVNKAKVSTADVKATNGVIHVIDQVMIPPDLKAALKTGSKKSDRKAPMGNPPATQPMPIVPTP